MTNPFLIGVRGSKVVLCRGIAPMHEMAPHEALQLGHEGEHDFDRAARAQRHG